ncbi:hypothetical protein KSP40_PGU000978 [Platanthera guangdongensis]|uniref:Uncharacterized protein n=1 Tax=Platanthera guangdongensis TaxID=2320717 RepID=A0ABR2MU31_9ASPA
MSQGLAYQFSGFAPACSRAVRHLIDEEVLGTDADVLQVYMEISEVEGDTHLELPPQESENMIELSEAITPSADIHANSSKFKVVDLEARVDIRRDVEVVCFPRTSQQTDVMSSSFLAQLKDCGEQLDIIEFLRSSRDWRDINEVLHGVEKGIDRFTTMDTLTQDAHIIQDILHHLLMIKSRQIVKPSRPSTSSTSGTRTVAVTSPPVSTLAEDLPATSPPPPPLISSPPVTSTVQISSTIIISTPSPTSVSPTSPQTEELFHPLHQYPHPDIESSSHIPSFNLLDDSFMDDSPSSPLDLPSSSTLYQQLLQDIIAQPSFTPSISIPLSSISTLLISQPSFPPSTSSPPTSLAVPPTVSTYAQVPIEHVDLPALADRLYELIAPRLSLLLETSLDPLLKSVADLSATLSSLIPQAIPSFGRLDPVLTESRQGKMPHEVEILPVAAAATISSVQAVVTSTQAPASTPQGWVHLAELDGPFVKLRLQGRFWHTGAAILASRTTCLKYRISVMPNKPGLSKRGELDMGEFELGVPARARQKIGKLEP